MPEKGGIFRKKRGQACGLDVEGRRKFLPYGFQKERRSRGKEKGAYLEKEETDAVARSIAKGRRKVPLAGCLQEKKGMRPWRQRGKESHL